MLAALALAACTAWHGQAVGHYRGEVQSEGLKLIDTWLEDGPTGLAGTYVLHEPTREVTGTLEPLGDAECGVALFRWTDLYGTGVARLQFHLPQHCFEGNWGRTALNPLLTWHSCTETPAISSRAFGSPIAG